MRVLFNASVVLAGLRSKNGASGELLRLTQSGQIEGLISQTIFDEIMRHCEKLELDPKFVSNQVLNIFAKNITKAPREDIVEKYFSRVTDPGDAHVLATFEEEHCGVLITLDKKHLLVLQGKIKGINIYSPGEFLIFRSK